MAAQGIRAGKAYVEIGTNNSQLTKGLKAAQAKLNNFASSVAGLGAKFTAIGVGIAAPLALATKSFATIGDAVGKAASRLGISAEALYELGFAAEQSGASMETVERAMRDLGKRSALYASQGEAAKNTIGGFILEMDRFKGLDIESKFTAIMDYLGEIPDAAVRSAAAMEVFGKSGAMLLPMIGHTQALREEARALGITITNDQVKAAEMLTDAFNRLRKGVIAISFSIGEILAPYVELVAAGMSKAIKAIREFIIENKAVVTVAAAAAVGFVALGSALITTALVAKVAAIGIGFLTSAITLLGTALAAIGTIIGALATPFGLIIALVGSTALVVAGATGNIGKALQYLRDTFDEVSATAIEAFGGIKDALSSGDWSLAASILWSAINVEFTRGKNALFELWRGVSTFLSNTWGDAMVLIKSAAVEAFSYLLNTWGETTRGLVEGAVSAGRFIKDVFVSLGRAIADIWRAASDIAEDMVMTVIADDSEALAQLNEMAKQERQIRDSRIKKARDEADAETITGRVKDDESLQKFMDEVQNDKQAVIDRIAQGEAESKRARAEQNAAAQKEADAALAAAKAKLSDYRKIASEQAKATKALQRDDKIDTPELPELPELTFDTTSLKQKMDQIGDFSVAAFGRLGFGQTAAEDRTAKASEATATNTERIAKLLESGATQPKIQ